MALLLARIVGLLGSLAVAILVFFGFWAAEALLLAIHPKDDRREGIHDRLGRTQFLALLRRAFKRDVRKRLKNRHPLCDVATDGTLINAKEEGEPWITGIDPQPEQRHNQARAQFIGVLASGSLFALAGFLVASCVLGLALLCEDVFDLHIKPIKENPLQTGKTSECCRVAEEFVIGYDEISLPDTISNALLRKDSILLAAHRWYDWDVLPVIVRPLFLAKWKCLIRVDRSKIESGWR